ncbi:MAG: AMP-binding protein [Opitutales bacterium]|nr:AMP-binding protein [Opitutales bacterium]
MAAAHPDVAAVRVPVGEKGETILYDERSFALLEKETRRTAALLDACGIRQGTRTLVMVRPGLDLIRLVFAFFMTGAVPVVIDPGMGLRSFLQCVRRTRPEALVGIPLAQIISHVFRPSFRSVRTRLSITGRFPRRLEGFGEGQGARLLRAGETAAILFTSGSTGAPKGVVYTHGMFDAQVRLIGKRFEIQPGEVDLPMLPIFALFNPAFGMTTVVPKMNPSRPATVDPLHIVRAIQQNGVTNSFGSPVLWEKISRYAEANSIQLPTVRRVLMAGAAVPPALMERFRRIIPNGEVFSPYGATEALPVAAISAAEVLGETRSQTEAGAGSCVGVPLREIDIRVVALREPPENRLEDTVELPAGEVGELLVCGPVVTETYDSLPEASRAAKLTDQTGRVWHRMGDLVYLDANGRIWFCGRKAERVEAHGTVFYPDRCEAIFNAHPRVFRTALIAWGDASKEGEEALQPALAVEPEREAFPKSSAARAEFAAELRALAEAHPHTRAIQKYFFVRRFPVDVRHNAKIHRLTLAKRLAHVTP